jgi:lambda family phage portal protein
MVSMVRHPWLNRFVGRMYGRAPEPELAPPPLPVVTADGWASLGAPARYGTHDGEKYPGGFGFTELLATDYWTLRARSTQLFKTNIYARGLVRRLVTNIINTGLAVEATPDASILGMSEDALAVWAELVENRFHLWERSPDLCDHKGQQAFGAIQAQAKLTAIISGDVLVVLLQDPVTGLPRVRLVDGSRVQSPSPFGAGGGEARLAPGHTIRHGVEVDREGRHVAFWVVQEPDASGQRRTERLPAIGPSTGRRQAWLVYGTPKLLDETRGEPLLSVILQSLREIDRYRDAVQRKAMINATLAMFIQKDMEVAGSRPITGGAVRKGTEVVAGPGKTPRVFNFAEMVPGAVLDELAPGETPHGFPAAGTDEKFADFESAIIYAIAWSHEVPPEILTLSFSSNYSASQAAINEFKLFLNVVRADYGDDFCQPIYVDWLISETLAGRIVASGLLEAWRDRSLFDRFAAWISADWTGAIKPSVDLVKQATGYTLLIKEGLITRDRAARETTGTKYSKNIAKLKRENQQAADALEPIVKLEKPPPPAPAAPPRGGEPERERDRKAAASPILTLVESTE